MVFLILNLWFRSNEPVEWKKERTIWWQKETEGRLWNKRGGTGTTSDSGHAMFLVTP
jgi:hypothetical protein